MWTNCARWTSGRPWRIWWQRFRAWCGAAPAIRAVSCPQRERMREEERMDAKDVFDPLAIAERWMDDGRMVALATVIETWGSAPRPVGSHLVIDGEGNFHGSVSGGCVEGAVIGEAMEVIADGEPRLLEFGVADETAWRVGLSCGGRIRVYVERVG